MRNSVPVLACVLLAALAGCSKKETNEPAVATASVSLAKERAAIGSPLRITYKFEPLAGGKIDGDYAVFVHVMDPDGEKLWQDDHQPPVPTSQWKPGQQVEYTRTVFVPNYPYIGEAVMRLGLYSPATGRRLALNANEASHKEYVVARFTLLPRSENIFLIYKEGWHGREIDPNDAASEWQWMKQDAKLTFRNPRKDVTFYLEYDARPDLFTPPQQVTVTAGGQPVASFTADARTRTLKTFPITAAQLGDGDMAEIGLAVDRTFRPSEADPRELGIRVFHTFVEPK